MEHAARASPMVALEALSFLLMPIDGRPGTSLGADERWSIQPAAEAADRDVVIWGRPPWASQTPTTTLLLSALARERALARLRRSPPHRFRAVTVHRWSPPAFRAGVARQALRSALLGGALVELWAREPGPRVLDVAARAAGAREPVRAFRPGSGGSALVRLGDASGGEKVFRTARAGGPADPARAAEALERLGRAGVPGVPALCGRGHLAGASWTTESAMSGRRPSRVRPQLTHQVADFCARLPQEQAPPTATAVELDALAETFPSRAGRISEISQTISSSLASLPAIMRHGDLWAGNILVRKGRLEGVVDWDAWHPEAVPGTDLLHLVAQEEGVKRGRSIGEVWLERPWLSEAFSSASDDYWRALRLRPGPVVLEGIGLAWWACQMANTLRRLPHLSADESWVARNIDPVLSTFHAT